MVNRFLTFSSNFCNVFLFRIGEGVNSEPLVILGRCRTPELQEGLLRMLEEAVTFELLLFKAVQLSWLMWIVCLFLSYHSTKQDYVFLTCCYKSDGSKFRLHCN